MIPLETTPLYSADSYPNRYWTAQRNTTEWSVFMRELTTAGNAIARLQLQLLAPTLYGAHIGEPLILSDPETEVVWCSLYAPQAYSTRTPSSRTCTRARSCT